MTDTAPTTDPEPGSEQSPGAPATSEPTGFWASVRSAMRGDMHDYTKGNLHRSVLLLAVPMVLEMAMESVFAVCDVYFVGRLGAEAVATVGLTESVLTLIYAVAIGLSMSTTALVARRIGEGDPAGASRAARQAQTLGLLLGAVVGIPAMFGGDVVLAWMGASEKTIAVGSGYASTLIGANVVILLIFLQNAVFRGAGDAALAMRSLWLANGINIVLDPCLIFGWGPFPELGVTGAAVATTIGRGTGVLYQTWHLRRGTGRVQLTGSWLERDVKSMATLVRISVGGIAQMLVATASWVALMRILAPFGENTLAGYTIAIRIVMFALLPSWGLSNAAATLVGQNLGAKNPDRAERAVWLTGAYNTAFLGTVTVIFVTLADPLVGLFQDDPDILATGAEALRVFSYGYVFYAWGMVLMQAFNGSGDTMTPTWVNVGVFWAGQIPMAWFLSREIGPSGVFWAVMISETGLAFVLAGLFRRGKWKTREI